MRHTILVLALLAVGSLIQPAEARMYKWVDDEGNVQYTQHPPPKGTQGEEMKVRGAGPSPDEAERNLEALRERAGASQKDREFQAEYTDYMRERDERIKQNCEIARQNLRVLETASRVQDRDASGMAYFLDDAARQAKIEETRRQVADYCN